MINTLYYENRLAYLQEEILKAEHKLESFPAGTLKIYNNGPYIKLYRQSKDKDGTFLNSYIPKSNIALAKSLASKRLLMAKLADMRNEVASIESFLHTRRKCKMDSIFDPNSIYASLLEDLPEFSTNEATDNAALHPESLTVQAPKGQLVRSKSEAIIAYALFQNDLEYYYESPLNIGITTIHPDFTIIHPQTKDRFIWEHFGLADESSYQANMFTKIHTYISEGYVPGKNLILTFETKDSPISIEYIQNLIDYHFKRS